MTPAIHLVPFVLLAVFSGCSDECTTLTGTSPIASASFEVCGRARVTRFAIFAPCGGKEKPCSFDDADGVQCFEGNNNCRTVYDYKRKDMRCECQCENPSCIGWRECRCHQ